MYDREVKIVQDAIGSLESEGDPSLIQALKEEQAAAATGLEFYGITKMVFERFLAERGLTESTRGALKKAIQAVKIMYGR
jgi:hypothetical protein